jgi:hypothetical protein
MNSTENNFDTLIDKFKHQMSSYPSIAQFWITYLETKKQNIAELLAQGELVIAQMQKDDDESKLKDIQTQDLMRVMLFKMTL